MLVATVSIGWGREGDRFGRLTMILKKGILWRRWCWTHLVSSVKGWWWSEQINVPNRQGEGKSMKDTVNLEYSNLSYVHRTKKPSLSIVLGNLSNKKTIDKKWYNSCPDAVLWNKSCKWKYGKRSIGEKCVPPNSSSSYIPSWKFPITRHMPVYSFRYFCTFIPSMLNHQQALPLSHHHHAIHSSAVI